MSSLTLCVAIAASLLVASVAANEAGPLDWDALVDQEAQNFEDPYASLTPAQMSDLVTIARLQQRLGRPEVDAAVREQITEQVNGLKTQLDQAGIDADWLIAQRWVVAERRRAAALAGNPALDGTKVEVSGFLIPAPADKDGVSTAYLVAKKGMCSHMPPPPPNQLLLLHLPESIEPPLLYTPVVVRGIAFLSETTRDDVFVVDGLVPMWSAWTLDVFEMDVF